MAKTLTDRKLRALEKQPAPPVVGFIVGAPDAFARYAAAFRTGLSQFGYVDGQNVAVEYRWAENQYDRLPTLAADLVRLRVAVIIAVGTAETLAAKAATTTVPIVFSSAADQDRTSALLRKSCEGRFEIAVGSSIHNIELQVQRARRHLQV